MVMTKKQTSAGVLYSFEIFGYQVYLMHTKRGYFRGGKKRSVTKRCFLFNGQVNSAICTDGTEEDKAWKGPCARTIEPKIAHLLYFKKPGWLLEWWKLPCEEEKYEPFYLRKNQNAQEKS